MSGDERRRRYGSHGPDSSESKGTHHRDGHCNDAKMITADVAVYGAKPEQAGQGHGSKYRSPAMVTLAAQQRQDGPHNQNEQCPLEVNGKPVMEGCGQHQAYRLRVRDVAASDARKALPKALPTRGEIGNSNDAWQCDEPAKQERVS